MVVGGGAGVSGEVGAVVLGGVPKGWVLGEVWFGGGDASRDVGHIGGSGTEGRGGRRRAVGRQRGRGRALQNKLWFRGAVSQGKPAGEQQTVSHAIKGTRENDEILPQY